jgi:hypothetical protein
MPLLLNDREFGRDENEGPALRRLAAIRLCAIASILGDAAPAQGLGAGGVGKLFKKRPTTKSSVNLFT